MLLDEFRLDGAAAIVTGGGGGMGRAISLALAEVGASVTVGDVVVEGGQQTVDLVKKAGGKAVFVKVDLGKRSEVDNMVETTVKEFGKVDILINNAGIQLAKPFIDLTEDEWHRVMNINLTSIFLCSQAAGKHMIKQGKGKVINIASNGGLAAATNQSVYCVSKAGVIMLTKALALEWARYNIRVNAIAPGYFRTPFSAKATEDEKTAAELLKRIPLRRFGEPKDLGPLVVYLASPACDYMTGETLLFDGGHLCHL
jgi:NAD(P)-dependent dehydrogenase (short-subunit alcohol dehydrogenase family)